ncbi:MAG: class I mannose-6-phosphate isomerase [bacterium]|nr:class I mannose-6-phosphate isomerase [bacterium]
MKEILFFEPVIIDLIWGREIWTVSAHEHGDCRVSEGTYKGSRLSELWQTNRELFGGIEGAVFPLLVKKIEARDDLSIQVHPDDAYAMKHENGSLGKTECWYVLDCAPDGTIIIGHHAKTEQEVADLIYNGRWNDLLREIPLKKGDFFQIEPGTIHAIKHNTDIMEIQQSSDITYRLYDYGRLKDGQPRELHLQESIDVIKAPFEEKPAYTGHDTSTLVSCKYYTVHHYQIEKKQQFTQDKAFQIVSILNGQGEVDGHIINGGDSFIIPAGYGEYMLTGKLEVLITAV